MTDLEFPDLASAAADAARPPAFDTLRRRAVRRRRVRAVTGTVAVAASVAAIASASLVIGDDSRRIEPARTPTPMPMPTPTASVSTPPAPTGTPSATPTATATPVTADEVVAGGSLFDVAVAGDRILTVWQRCDSDYLHCRFAWQLAGPSSVRRQLLPGSDGASVSVAGDRFVLTDSGQYRSIVVDPDGTSRAVVDDGALEPRPGLALVRAGKPGLALVDAERGVRSPLRTPAGVAGWAVAQIDGEGGIWATALTSATDVPQVSDVGLWHSRDGRAWTRRSLSVGKPTTPAYVVAAGDHVAALASHDGATVLPVGDLAVTPDGGRTWHDLTRDDVPFGYVDSMAATSGGTLFVVGGSLDGKAPAALYRSTNDSWTRFEAVELPALAAGTVRPAGSSVVIQSGSNTDPTLVTIDDDGHVTQLDSLR